MTATGDTARRRPWQIWKDRRGRVSALRLGAIALVLTPLAKALYDGNAIIHGARPLNDLIHRAGFWALIFLGVTLAVTPLRRILRYGGLLDIRRMIGVAAFALLVTHLTLYVADQSFNLIKVFTEITKRVYLIIGGVAWLGLAVLAATSTDAMVRRLGGLRWRRLHQAVYVLVLLGLIHHFQQTKADVAVPTLAAAMFAWLMGYRLLAWWRGSAELSSLALTGLAVVVALLTIAGEAIGIGFAFNVSPLRVLETAFDIGAGIRPGWQILAAGIVVAILDFACARWRNDVRRGRQPATAE